MIDDPFKIDRDAQLAPGVTYGDALDAAALEIAKEIDKEVIHMMTKVKEPCLECGEESDWIRHTQFAGDHPYCDKHARLEKDFGEDDSYAFWSKIVKVPE
jgi:hypothetical protein